MINNVFGIAFEEITELDHKNWFHVEEFYFGENKTKLHFKAHFQNLTNLFTDVGYSFGTELAAR